MKPFTFGVYLPKPQFTESTINLNTTEITLNFSTSEAKLGIYFYNSLVKKRFEPFPLPGGNQLLLKRVILIKEKRISSSEAVFKTLSPFLVRLHHQMTNEDEYLTRDHNMLVSQTEIIIGVMLEKLTGKKERVDFMPVKLNKAILIKHFGMIVDGNTGVFKLTGRPEVLEFIYRVGIGSRRSEGFGLLEVIG
jgi:CRISPR-associated endoribonuclease Cas6